MKCMLGKSGSYASSHASAAVATVRRSCVLLHGIEHFGMCFHKETWVVGHQTRPVILTQAIYTKELLDSEFSIACYKLGTNWHAGKCILLLCCQKCYIISEALGFPTNFHVDGSKNVTTVLGLPVFETCINHYGLVLECWTLPFFTYLGYSVLFWFLCTCGLYCGRALTRSVGMKAEQTSPLPVRLVLQMLLIPKEYPKHHVCQWLCKITSK